ncbi:TonB-dependent receptor [uncultured Oxalicibacterium sp.]|uniref:TonB-dependent receptor family protein n=1 Tax=uncultured Oxalicibacterium sp. TaxID=1168540 RepID=UPI0025CC608A|nr:TonB-dependent receptor [uncultured Oxalicibacterium sp.]
MQKKIARRRVMPFRAKPVFTLFVLGVSISIVHAQEQDSPSSQTLPEIVVSGSRSESNRFDVPAAVDVVQINGFAAQSPLVNLSEVLGVVPGIQIRERQNYSQDLQVSIRGFGTRSTFGVRGVRILVDGIPATMPDGQGQSSNASLASASRIEVLRGPMAQLYGNSAGGVLQVFTKEPPLKPEASFSLGAGSDNQRVIGASIGGGSAALGGTLDVTQFSTDGYRDHSAARRNTLNAKIVAKPSTDTKITAVFNSIDQPLSQDPLGLTRADFQMNPRQVTPGAITFNTRKTVTQQQMGLVVEQRLSSHDVLNARVYGGKRNVFQTLAFPGGALVQAGGVIDLDRGYGGIGLDWRHQTEFNGLPLNWTLGVEIDSLSERRRGFVNNNGVAGALRRDEKDKAKNTDVFAQVDWTFAPNWRAIAGVRLSRVRMSVDDDFVVRNPDPTLDNPDDSGETVYTQTSPVIGVVWSASDNLNIYSNLGQGFETPTLAELAYRANGTGPNLGLRASTSTHAEIGAKIRQGHHLLDLAVFHSRSKNEIVQQQSQFGRAIFQNVDGVERRGAEASWRSEWSSQLSTSVAYTWLEARFRKAFSSSAGITDAGNRLPGAPQHSLYTELQYRWWNTLTTAVEMRADSKVYVNDANSDAASGYTLFNLRAGYVFNMKATKVMLFGRIDNVFDRAYAGSVIVNEGNQRFFEAAPGRRFYVGARTEF